MLADRVGDLQEAFFLGDADEDGGDRFLGGGDVFDGVVQGGGVAGPLELGGACSLNFEMFLREDSSAVKDEDSGGAILSGEVESGLEFVDVPAELGRVDGFPSGIGRREIQ